MLKYDDSTGNLSSHLNWLQLQAEVCALRVPLMLYLFLVCSDLLSLWVTWNYLHVQDIIFHSFLQQTLDTLLYRSSRGENTLMSELWESLGSLRTKQNVSGASDLYSHADRSELVGRSDEACGIKRTTLINMATYWRWFGSPAASPAFSLQSTVRGLLVLVMMGLGVSKAKGRDVDEWWTKATPS